MLQAHSLLWHYLWLAPHIYSLVLVALLMHRGFHRQYPVFCSYLIFASLEGICLYVFDISSRITPNTWWAAFWVGTILEGMLKFAVIGELLHHLLRSWPSIAKLGRNIVSGAGGLLVLLAALAAAYSAPDNTPWFVSGAHVLLQTIYLAAAGLIISMFALAAWLHIPWERPAFGIALGAGLVWCEHLAIWALVSGGIVRNKGWHDFANMGTYHFVVLIWSYYLLVPHKVASPSVQEKNPSLASPLAAETREKEIAPWNRELERLIHP